MSTDLDVLVNARVVTGGVREFVVAIEEIGFALAGASPEGIAHRYRRRGVDDVPDAQRLDLALLLSLVDDPIALAGQLTKKDRQRLRSRAEMADADHRAWTSLSDDAADRGRAALRLLAG